MADILLVTWDGGGNVPPALGIADELRRRGHRTRFLGHRGQEAALTAGGHGFTAYAEARDLVGHRPVPLPRLVGLFSERAMGRDLVAEAARRPTDLVVVDALLLGALHGAAAAGLRYVPLQHLFDSYQRGSWLRGPVGTLARLRLLRPVALWDDAELVVSTTVPELDPGRTVPPPNVRFTGPVVAAPRAGAPQSGPPSTGSARGTGRPEATVLVSLSTFHYAGMAALLQRVVDATADLDARVVVTTGPVLDPADLRVHDRVELHRYVDHADVMPQASMVVSHGGHGTAMRALAHDLPVLVLPVNRSLDHPAVGRAVERAGAGRVLPASTSSARMRPVLADLLADGPHRDAARRVGERVRSTGGAAAAADALEGLLSRSARPPVRR